MGAAAESANPHMVHTRESGEEAEAQNTEKVKNTKSPNMENAPVHVTRIEKDTVKVRSIQNLGNKLLITLIKNIN